MARHLTVCYFVYETQAFSSLYLLPSYCRQQFYRSLVERREPLQRPLWLSSLFACDFFVGLTQGRGLTITTKNTWWIGTTNWKYFGYCSLEFLSKIVEPLSFSVHICQMWWMCWNLSVSDTVWASTWCRNCSKMGFCLRPTAVWYYAFTSAIFP